MKAITNNAEKGEQIFPLNVYTIDGSPRIWTAEEQGKEYWLEIPNDSTTLMFNKDDLDVPWKDVSDLEKLSFIPTHPEDGFLILPHSLSILLKETIDGKTYTLKINFDASLSSAIGTAFLNIPPQRILGNILTKIGVILSKPISETNILDETSPGESIPVNKFSGVDLKFSLMGLKMISLTILDKDINEYIVPGLESFIQSDIEVSSEKEIKVDKPLFSKAKVVTAKPKEKSPTIDAKESKEVGSIPSPKGSVPSPPAPAPRMEEVPSPKSKDHLEQVTTSPPRQAVPPPPSATAGVPPSPPKTEVTSSPTKAPPPPKVMPSSPLPKPAPAPSAQSTGKMDSQSSSPAKSPRAMAKKRSSKQSGSLESEIKEMDDDELGSFIEDLEKEEEMAEEEELMEASVLFPEDIGKRDYRPLSEKSLKIDWYDRMILQRTYPLIIKISEQRFEKKKSITSLVSGERISEVTETIEIEQEKPIVVRPQFPGSIIVPSERVISPEDKESTLRFFVTPLSKGWMDAHIEFLQDNKTIDDIRLRTKVIDHRLAKIAAISGSIVSAVPATFAFLFNVSLTEFFEERIHGINGSIMVGLQLFLTILLFGSAIGLYQWSNFRSFKHRTFTG